MLTDSAATLEVIKDRISAEANGILAMIDEVDETSTLAARLIYGCTGKLFVSGSGTSGTIARRMAHIFAVTGTPSIFLPAMDSLHGTLGVVTEGDLVIVISKGGGSAEINDLVTRCKDRGAGVIALTCTSGTPMTAAADLSVVLGTDENLDLGGMIAMGSTLAHAAWGDSIATALMRARGYSWERVHHSHPGGAVGAKTELPQEVAPLALEPLRLDELRSLKG